MADINFENYKNKNGKGLWSIVKNAKGLAISRKQFDIDEGVEVNPNLEYFTLADAQEIKAKLTKRLSDINLIVKEAELL